MSDVNRIEVCIDDAIRSRPDLLAQVEAATSYFLDAHALAPPLDGPTEPTRLEWTLRPDEGAVHVRGSEADRYGRWAHTEPIPLSFMADRVNRQLSVGLLWRSMLGERGRLIHKRLDDMIRELEREEENGRPLGA
jgi:hypothetical protein